MSPPPSLSLLFKDKKHKKIKISGEWRPLAFVIFLQWLGNVSGVGCLPVAPLHASAYASSRLISSVLFIAPKRKKKASSFIFIVLPLGFCFKGKRTREKKDKKDRKDEDGFYRTGVPLDRFLHLQARKKDAPEQKLSLSLSIPVAIFSFVLSLACSLSLSQYLSLTHSFSVSLSLSLSMRDGSRHPFLRLLCLQGKRKTSKKKTFRGVPFARLTHRKRLKGQRLDGQQTQLMLMISLYIQGRWNGCPFPFQSSSASSHPLRRKRT